MATLLRVEDHLKRLREAMGKRPAVATAYWPSPSAEEALFLRLPHLQPSKAREEGGGVLYAAYMALTQLYSPLLSMEEVVERFAEGLYRPSHYIPLIAEAWERNVEVEGLMPLHRLLALSYVTPMSFYAEVISRRVLDAVVPAFLGEGGDELLKVREDLVETLKPLPYTEYSTGLRYFYLREASRLWRSTYGGRRGVVRGREDVRMLSDELEGLLDEAVEKTITTSPSTLKEAMVPVLLFYLSFLGGLTLQGRDYLRSL